MGQRILSYCTAAMLLCAMTVPGFAAAGGNAKTAQGIMVNLQAGGDFVQVMNMLYKFNSATASTYYSNTWDGNAPTVTCKGPGCATAPTAPAAPAPNSQKVDGTPQGRGIVQVNECTFFNGGTLTGTTYTQTVQVSTGSGKTGATYTYEYTYNVAPTTNPVAALTAWDLVQSSGTGITPITVTAQIAGESVVQSNQFPAPGKFSFSLWESDGITSRVQNLQVTVTDSTNTVIATYTPGSTLVAGQDFAYTTNAGSNGTTILLKDGDALTILNTDSQKGNDNGGANGTDLMQATMDPIQLSLGSGTYTVTFTGVVKDNTGTINTGFTLVQHINIMGAGCGQL